MLYKKLDLLLQKNTTHDKFFATGKKKKPFNYVTSEKVGFFTFEY